MKFLSAIIFIFTANFVFANSTEYLPLPLKDIVRHTYYTLSYNESKEQANWVYYTLTDNMVKNSGEERGNFKIDKLVSTGSAKSSDYTKSGYDRGHLCPAADMGFNPVAMEESFLMSNISPQVPDFNRGIWKELESTVRKWTLKEHQLYIVTGPVFQNNKGTIGKDKVVVPGYYFKVIYDPTGDPKMIAFVFPNQNSVRPITDFVVSVDEAERLTGLDLFSQLPDDKENKLEGKVQLAGWFAGFESETPPSAPSKTTILSNEIYFYMILVGVILIVVIFVWLWNRRKR